MLHKYQFSLSQHATGLFTTGWLISMATYGTIINKNNIVSLLGVKSHTQAIHSYWLDDTIVYLDMLFQ